MHQARVGNNVINGVIASVLKRGVTLRAKNSIIWHNWAYNSANFTNCLKFCFLMKIIL